jgi:glycosyltransferase involved in cell wall biosynthesis
MIWVLPKNRTVLTIHDLVFLHTHKGLTRWFLKWAYLDLPVKNAKYITTISEKSKNEIIYYTKCDPNKIRVIPNPVDIHLTYQKKQFNDIKPRLLFLGTKVNKNLELSILSLYDLPIHLRIIGELTQLQHEALLKYKIDYRSYAELSDEDIHQEFINCDIVFFPSTYEGFGLVLLEAMQNGVPVIAANNSAIPEVLGSDKGNLFDTGDEGHLSMLMKRYSNRLEWERLQQQGYERLKYFEPDLMKSKIDEVYLR